MDFTPFLPSKKDEQTEEPKKIKREELKKLGYRPRIAKFKGLCDECGRRFPAGTRIWWKLEKEGITCKTSTICSNCVDEDS